MAPRPLDSLRYRGDAPQKHLFTQSKTAVKDKNICVTGQIEEYKGKPQIILTDAQQLKV